MAKRRKTRRARENPIKHGKALLIGGGALATVGIVWWLYERNANAATSSPALSSGGGSSTPGTTQTPSVETTTNANGLNTTTTGNNNSTSPVTLDDGSVSSDIPNANTASTADISGDDAS
jgi:hypothetical protein